MDFYPKSYHNNPNEYKSKKKSSWKEQGVKHDDFDDLYVVYMNTMECQYCNKPFKNSLDRHLDHDHKTGLFRKILCCACNSKDSHLRHPNHFTSNDKRRKADIDYYYRHREKRLEYAKNKPKKTPIIVNCFFCNKQMRNDSLRLHYKQGYCLIKPK